MAREIRVRRRGAHTPVVRYENRKTGRTVTLVMVMHMGTSAYFIQLNDIIAGLETAGAVICYESVTLAPDKQWAAASTDERAMQGLPWLANHPTILATCRYLGWIQQSAGLKYTPSWRNVDMTDLDLVRRVQPQNLSETRDALDSTFAGVRPEQLDMVTASVVAVLIRLLALAGVQIVGRWFTPKGDSYRHFFRVAVDERNRGALAGLPQDADAVLLWGAGHLPGLAAGLRKPGYRRRATTWVPVGKLPAIWPCLRACWTWLRASDEDDSQPVPGEADESGHSARSAEKA